MKVDERSRRLEVGRLQADDSRLTTTTTTTTSIQKKEVLGLGSDEKANLIELRRDNFSEHRIPSPFPISHPIALSKRRCNSFP